MTPWLRDTIISVLIINLESLIIIVSYIDYIIIIKNFKYYEGHADWPKGNSTEIAIIGWFQNIYLQWYLSSVSKLI